MSSVTEQLDRIAEHVGRYGIERSGAELVQLAMLARTHAVQPALVSLLTDTGAADVVRSRAFARIVVGLRSLRPEPLSFVA